MPKIVCQELSSCRLMLLTDAGSNSPLSSLLMGEALANWELVETSNPEQARFVQQWDPCDVILVDHNQPDTLDPDTLAFLAFPRRITLVILSDSVPPARRRKGEQNPQHWLPRQLVLEHPEVLTVILAQAAEFAELQRQTRLREQELQGCRRQVKHLADLLWQGLPGQSTIPWLSQRQMVERLHEEVTRSQRYGDPLAVVLGQLIDSPRQAVDGLDPGELAGWMARQVSRHKRRSDVAGQYGPKGFLMLLPQTSEPAATHCCRRLLPVLESAKDLPEGASAAPGIRFGIASFSSSSATVTSLLARAEERLEQAADHSSERLAAVKN